MKLHSIYNNKGFTLIEMIVSLSLFLFICYFGVVFSLRTLRSSGVNSQVVSFYYTLLEARNRALTNSKGIPHGVYVSSSTYVLFQGNSYDSKEEANEYTRLNQDVEVGGMKEIIFSPLSGDTTNVGSVTFLLQDASTSINIFENGQISF